MFLSGPGPNSPVPTMPSHVSCLQLTMFWYENTYSYELELYCKTVNVKEKIGISAEILVTGAYEQILYTLYAAFKELDKKCPNLGPALDQMAKHWSNYSYNTLPSGFTQTNSSSPGFPTKDYEQLPGLNELIVLPCKHSDGNSKLPLKDAIIHLNDYDNLTKNEIADWLETLDIDLRFQIEGEK